MVHSYYLPSSSSEPLKVLCDGNFLIHSWKIYSGDLKKKLETFLGSKCRLFITKCAINEISLLGSSFSETCRLLKGIDMYKCAHYIVHKSPSECLLEQIGHSNQHHLL